MICVVAADAADVKVVTKKTCTTWKTKCALCVNSSTRAADGTPERLAQTIEQMSVRGFYFLAILCVFSREINHLLRQIIGTNDIRATNAADGNSPSIAPLINSGKYSLNLRNGSSVDKYVTLEMTPTIAAGNDQNMTRAARPP